MNPFDQLAGLQKCDLSGVYDADDGLGFLKKIKKQLKRTQKSVKNEVKRSGKKVVAEVKRNPAIAGALVVAAGVMLSPAAGAALKAGLAKGGAMLAKGASSVISAAKGLKVGSIVSGAGKLAVGAAKLAPVATQLMQAKAEVAAAENAINTVADNSAYAIDQQHPEFQRLVQTMRAQGYTDEQIVQTWLQSQAYLDTTKTAVVQNMGYQLRDQYQMWGYPEQQAQQMAIAEAERLGEEAAMTMRAENLPNHLPLILGGGALLYFFLSDK